MLLQAVPTTNSRFQRNRVSSN